MCPSALLGEKRGRFTASEESVGHRAHGKLWSHPESVGRVAAWCCPWSTGSSEGLCQASPLPRCVGSPMWGQRSPNCAGCVGASACCCTGPCPPVLRELVPMDPVFLMRPLPLAAHPAPGELQRQEMFRSEDKALG